MGIDELMDMISIKLLRMEDKDRLFEFEAENRRYFDEIGLSRNNNYYNYTLFHEVLGALLIEQEKDICYMYLVLNVQGNVIGRVNLTNIIRGAFCKAEIGYRMGHKYQGKGYATQAIKLAIIQANLKHHLHRLEAGTSPHNIGSQVVLIKNAFRLVGTYCQYIFQGDSWTDSLLFEKIIDGK